MADAVFGHGFVKVQRQLLAGGRLQVHQHHDGFGVLVAGVVDVFQDGAGRLGDVGAVTGGAGADEGHDLARVAAMFAQLFCGAAG